MQIKLSNFIIHTLKYKSSRDYNFNYTNTKLGINYYVFYFSNQGCFIGY